MSDLVSRDPNKGDQFKRTRKSAQNSIARLISRDFHFCTTTSMENDLPNMYVMPATPSARFQESAWRNPPAWPRIAFARDITHIAITRPIANSVPFRRGPTNFERYTVWATGILKIVEIGELYHIFMLGTAISCCTGRSLGEDAVFSRSKILWRFVCTWKVLRAIMVLSAAFKNVIFCLEEVLLHYFIF